jgi:hypothetical protein
MQFSMWVMMAMGQWRWTVIWKIQATNNPHQMLTRHAPLSHPTSSRTGSKTSPRNSPGPQISQHSFHPIRDEMRRESRFAETHTTLRSSFSPGLAPPAFLRLRSTKTEVWPQPLIPQMSFGLNLWHIGLHAFLAGTVTFSLPFLVTQSTPPAPTSHLAAAVVVNHHAKNCRFHPQQTN